MWQILSKLINIQDKSGKLLDNTADIARRWKEHFEELYNIQNPVDKSVLAQLPSTTTDEMDNFMREEVVHQIKKLKTNKAPGFDNISAEMIKAGGDVSVHMLHSLSNRVFEDQCCPEDWGKAVIVPIYKKNDKTVCENYRGISLLSTPGKVFTGMLQERLKKHVEAIVAEEQAGFRAGRSTVDQIFTVRQLAEKFCESNRTLYNNFIDYKQAFDSVWQTGLWQVMRHYGIPERLVRLLENLYSKCTSAVRVDGELTDWFNVIVGVRQGCNLSPYLFLLLLEAVLKLALKDFDSGANVYGTRISNLRFADDIDLIAESPSELQELTDKVDQSSNRLGLRINKQKTKTMTISKEHEDLQIMLNGEQLEQVSEFVYLGSTITEDGKCGVDIRKRIGLASGVIGRLSKIWKSKDISVKTKVHVYKALVVPTLTYGSECWTLKKEDERKLHSLEMNCLRRIIGVTRRDRIQNTVVRVRANVNESIVEEIRRRRLSWFGHISRMEIDRLPPRALYCHVTGERSQGRQAKKWLENIKEDFELRNVQFEDAIARCKDRSAWRQLISSTSSSS